MTTLRSERHTPDAADVVVIGGGLVGLCCALALGERGTSVIILDRHLPGEASPAAAGLLAPGVEESDGPAHTFALAARDRYPSFVESLASHTRIHVPLNRLGILAVGGEWRAGRSMHPGELADLEPCLRHHDTVTLHEYDGAVDNVQLLAAIRARLAQLPLVRAIDALAEEISLEGSRPRVTTATGDRFEGERLILAAGAWVSWLRGVPGAIPVEPVRGQMLALASRALSHGVMGRDAYLVPRGEEILVGATMERVGLQVGTTPEALAALHRAAIDICPALSGAPVTRSWSGLRPVSPDMLPIIGPHPADDRVLLACGHSRNGILMAPLTGDCLAALILGEEPGHDLNPFVLERFL
ncbi:MAG TPA: FAD-dependent oxidoreductase [Gemmatimonadaceae bacterium]|nr:FAD-dependent oxidoreductase [Gemmatimonadaceae bacterium]